MRLDTLLARKSRPTRCSMGKAMAELAARDPELHADLQEWVDRERKGSATRVWEILTDDYGYDVGYQQVGHHRRGTCGCPK